MRNIIILLILAFIVPGHILALAKSEEKSVMNFSKPVSIDATSDGIAGTGSIQTKSRMDIYNNLSLYPDTVLFQRFRQVGFDNGMSIQDVPDSIGGIQTDGSVSGGMRYYGIGNGQSAFRQFGIAAAPDTSDTAFFDSTSAVLVMNAYKKDLRRLDHVNSLADNENLWLVSNYNFINLLMKGNGDTFLRGNVGIGTLDTTAALNVAGTIRQSAQKSCATGLTTDASGSINGCVASDERLMQNVAAKKYAPGLILALKPVEYHWQNGRDAEIHSGFTAQGIGQVLPSAVVPAGSIYKGVDTDAVLAVVVQEVQEQRRRLDVLYWVLGGMMIVLFIVGMLGFRRSKK